MIDLLMLISIMCSSGGRLTLLEASLNWWTFPSIKYVLVPTLMVKRSVKFSPYRPFWLGKYVGTTQSIKTLISAAMG